MHSFEGSVSSPASSPSLLRPEGNDAFAAVLTVSDEELLVFSPPGDRAPSPVFAQEASTVPRRCGERSLRLRGLAEPASDDGEVRPGELLALLLALRDGASGVLVVDATDGSTAMTLVAHVVEDLVLAETVDREGFHTFDLGPRDQLASYLQRWLVPEGARDGTETLVLTDEEAVETLGRATRQADAIVRYAGDGLGGSPPLAPAADLHGLFLGPDGSYRTTAAPGQAGPVVFQPLRAADAGTWLASLLEPVPR